MPHSEQFDLLPHDNEPRRAIAIEAATLIADAGMGYEQARAKAAARLFGNRVPRNAMPDQQEIDRALLEHLELFDEQGHAQRVTQMRAACLSLMTVLESFNPFITGAAWKGIVSEHVHAHLQLFTDDSKMVAITLINLGVELEATQVRHFAGKGDVEALALTWHDTPFQLSLYAFDDLRGGLKTKAHHESADRGTIAQLIAKMQPPA
jgi:hypothetical protein